MAEILFEHKEEDTDFKTQIKVWKVKIDEHYPEGIKYSLVVIDKNSMKRVLGFDNHYGKGHHFHVFNREFKYNFVDQWQVISDFEEMFDKIKRRLLK